jgi:hypothetical protein
MKKNNVMVVDCGRLMLDVVGCWCRLVGCGVWVMIGDGWVMVDGGGLSGWRLFYRSGQCINSYVNNLIRKKKGGVKVLQTSRSVNCQN